MSKAYALDVDCEFGGMSAKENAKISVTIDRGKIETNELEEMFVGQQVDVEISLLNRSDAQKRLPGTEEEIPVIATTAISKNLSIKPKKYGISLVFALAAIDVRKLAEFAGEVGVLKATALGPIGDDEDGDDDDDLGSDAHDSIESLPGQKALPTIKRVVSADPAGAAPLTDLVPFGMTKKKCAVIADVCGGKTIGHLEKFMRENAYWNRDLPGFGEQWITKLQDAHLAYRLKFPMPSEEPTDTTSEAEPVDQAALLLTLNGLHYDVTAAEIAEWSDDERLAAREWARRLAAWGDTVNTDEPPLPPDFLAVDEPEPALTA